MSYSRKDAILDAILIAQSRNHPDIVFAIAQVFAQYIYNQSIYNTRISFIPLFSPCNFLPFFFFIHSFSIYQISPAKSNLNTDPLNFFFFPSFTQTSAAIIIFFFKLTLNSASSTSEN